MMIPNKSGALRQWFAWLLLLCFVSDIVVDSIPPLHASEDSGSSAAFSFLGGSGSNPGDDHPDCGLGDGCALTHHHHFPTVLSRSCLTVAVGIIAFAKSDDFAVTGQSPLTDHPIRAPPSI